MRRMGSQTRSRVMDRPKGAAVEELPGKPEQGWNPSLAQNSLTVPTLLRNTREIIKRYGFPGL